MGRFVGGVYGWLAGLNGAVTEAPPCDPRVPPQPWPCSRRPLPARSSSAAAAASRGRSGSHSGWGSRPPAPPPERVWTPPSSSEPHRPPGRPQIHLPLVEYLGAGGILGYPPTPQGPLKITPDSPPAAPKSTHRPPPPMQYWGVVHSGGGSRGSARGGWTPPTPHEPSQIPPMDAPQMPHGKYRGVGGCCGGVPGVSLVSDTPRPPRGPSGAAGPALPDRDGPAGGQNPGVPRGAILW